MAVSSQYLLHLLCLNFSSIGHTFIELLTVRLASCWLISAAKATISSAVPMSTQLCVSVCVPCVCGKGRKQIFPISPPFYQCWRSQYCLFLVPGHTHNPLSPELSAETSRKRNVVATEKVFLKFYFVYKIYISRHFGGSPTGDPHCADYRWSLCLQSAI